MAKNKFIKPDDVDAIVHMIRGWPREKIGWDDLCTACKPVLGYIPTRQGLNGHQPIKDAFRAKKAGSKNKAPARKPLPSSLAVASDRISRLDATVTSLQEENARLRDRLVTWQYNAFKRGLTQAQLEEPLPTIDRERNEI
jgi:hypothetical protein